MDGQPQPTSLRNQVASCLQQLEELKQLAERGVYSYPSESGQKLLKGVEYRVNEILRRLRTWNSDFEQGTIASKPPTVKLVESLFRRLHRRISEASIALNSRLVHRKLLLLGLIVRHKRLSVTASLI